MLTDQLEVDYWTKLFYSTFEWVKRGAWSFEAKEDESVFRNACGYHLSRLHLSYNNVRYCLAGIEYQAGESATEHAPLTL